MTKFEGQEILEIICPTTTKKRLWITLLNKSYLNKYHINKGALLDILLLSQTMSRYTMRKKEKPSRQKKCPNNYLPKDWLSSGKTTSKRKNTSCCQTGGFLNRCDFAYAGRDIVNQVGKVTPKLLKQATGEINKIAQQRINQVVHSGGAEIE